MLKVPVLFQNLLRIHAVDVRRFADDTCMEGGIRTRTWPGSGADRRVLTSLPQSFPRFKGRIAEGSLRIEAMRVTNKAVFSAMPRYTRLTMPLPQIPETILDGMDGQRLCQLLSHPAIDTHTVITGHRMEQDSTGEWQLHLELEMESVDMQPVESGGGSIRLPDLEGLIASTHARIEGSPLMPENVRSDPRQWEKALDNRYRVIGLALSRDPVDGRPLVTVRFPYDRSRMRAIGRDGVGAWFDRDIYAWQLAVTSGVMDGLSEFLGRHADIIVAPDGSLHFKRGN